MADQSLYFYTEPEGYGSESAEKHLTAESAPRLKSLATEFDILDDWDAEAIQAVIKKVVAVQEVKFPMVALPLRVALTGDTATPSIDITVQLIGKARTLARIDRAIQFIG